MDGIIIINKPSGITSHDVVRRIKIITKAKKVGHAGTLDPLAKGVLPILLNKATKFSNKIMGGEKEYIATIKLGESTDTDDADGVVVGTRPIPNDIESRLKAVLPTFYGVIEQRPPRFSAIKHNGKPLYKMARQGVQFEPPSRQVEIKELELIEVNPPILMLRIKCSKGTYIRSLARDMGEKLGCLGHLAALIRTECGGFSIKESVELEKIYSLQDVLRVLRTLPSYGATTGT